MRENKRQKTKIVCALLPACGLVLSVFCFLPFVFSHLVSAEVGDSKNYSLDEGGFVIISGKTESTSFKQQGASGDLAGTMTSTNQGKIILKPGLVQVLFNDDESDESSEAFPYDIKEVFAKESVMGKAIESISWQAVNNPYFYWTVLGPEKEITGYSLALDSVPDEIIDAKEASFSYSKEKISDGKHLFHVMAQGASEKWGKEGVFEIWVDVSAPAIISFSPENKALLNQATPTIQLELKDQASGVEQNSIVLKLNQSKVNALWDAEQNRVSYTPSSPLSDGFNSVSFDVSDLIGNKAPSLIWSFTIDTTPPEGSVEINNGDSSTTSIYVKLNFESKDLTTLVKEMMISGQPSFAGAKWEPFSSLKDSWALTPVSGEQKVYAKFKDSVGNESVVYNDSIELVIIAPDTLITSGPSGLVESTTATFTYSASESNSYFQYRLDNADWSEWTQQTLVTIKDIKTNNHYFTVKAGKDLDNNGSIDLDEQDPTPAMRSWSVSASTDPTIIQLPPERPVRYWYKE